MVVRYHWICGCNQRAMLKTVRFFRQKKTKGKWPIITWNSLGNVRRSWCCLSPANGNNISSGMRMKQVDQGPVTRPLAQAWAWLVVEHAHGQMGVFSPGSTWLFKQKFLTLLKSGRARADEIEGELKWSLEGGTTDPPRAWKTLLLHLETPLDFGDANLHVTPAGVDLLFCGRVGPGKRLLVAPWLQLASRRRWRKTWLSLGTHRCGRMKLGRWPVTMTCFRSGGCPIISVISTSYPFSPK